MNILYVMASVAKVVLALYQISLKTVVLVMIDLNVGCNSKSEVCVANDNKDAASFVLD